MFYITALVRNEVHYNTDSGEVKDLFIPPSRKGYFCSSISDRKSRFYPQVSKSRFYPLVNKVNLNLEHRMNKRVAAVMAAGDRNS